MCCMGQKAEDISSMASGKYGDRFMGYMNDLVFNRKALEKLRGDLMGEDSERAASFV